MIDHFRFGEETEISNLVEEVFNHFIAPEYSETGRKNFLNYITPSAISERNRAGNILLNYKADGKIVGIIEIRDKNHITLFFVDPAYHRKGIGRKLTEEVIGLLKGKTDHISVNSSEFAEPVYRSMGFERVGVLEEKDGIKFIPMEKML